MENGIKLYDGSYKDLYQNELMVEDLLKISAKKLARHLRFDTLRRCPTELISEEKQILRGDAIWKIQDKNNEWLYFFIMIEFQSQPDKWMPLRVLVYAALLWWNLCKNDENTKKHGLPPVFPIVLYNGKRKWAAVRNVKELFDARIPKEIAPFLPAMKYFIIDMGRFPEAALRKNEDTLTAILFQMERSATVKDLEKAWFKLDFLSKKYSKLIETVSKYFFMKAKRNPKFKFENLSIKRENKMFETVIENIREEGREEGKILGMKNSIAMILKSRFGTKFEHIEDLLSCISDSSLLSALIADALTVNSLKDFSEKLKLIINN